MRLDSGGLFVFGRLLLRLVQLLDEGEWLAREAAVDLAPRPRSQERQYIDWFEGEESVKVDAAEGKFAEGAAFGDDGHGGGGGVAHDCLRKKEETASGGSGFVAGLSARARIGNRRGRRLARCGGIAENKR